MAIETSTLVDDGGACLLATSFIFLAMMSKPVNAGTPTEDIRATTTGDATTTGEATMRGDAQQ